MAKLTPEFFQKILKMEGGYQNMAGDNGNHATGCPTATGTKYGVSSVAYRQWVGRCPTEQEMLNLTKETAFQFYAWYFNYYNLYPIENQQLFELLANNTMGAPSQAARAEQRALRRMGLEVAVDGARGPKTIQALNTAARRDLKRIYNLVREEWISYLMKDGPVLWRSALVTRVNQHYPPLGGDFAEAGSMLPGLLILSAVLGAYLYRNR